MGDALQEREDKVFYNSANVAETLKVDGDTNNRFQRFPTGKMQWGSGSATPDCTLDRVGAGIMQLSDGAMRGSIVTLSATTTLSAATHANRLLLLTGTGAAKTQTLPAATGTGDRYLFVVGAVNTSNHVINVTTDDVMYGNIITNSTSDTPDLAQPWPTAADSDTITLNGTTQGGAAIGDYVECIDIATDKWLVRGVTTTSGVEATPFSAAVS
jgi:hypothetical protein